MPLFYFQCSGCEKEVKKILQPADSTKEHWCECGGSLKRTPRPASGQVKEIIDTGLMPRRLERPADVVRLQKERIDTHKKKKSEL